MHIKKSMIRYYVAGWKDAPPFFTQKKLKKACILLHFCIIILYKGKAIPYHPSFGIRL